MEKFKIMTISSKYVTSNWLNAASYSYENLIATRRLLKPELQTSNSYKHYNTVQLATIECGKLSSFWYFLTNNYQHAYLPWFHNIGKPPFLFFTHTFHKLSIHNRSYCRRRSLPHRSRWSLLLLQYLVELLHKLFLALWL